MKFILVENMIISDRVESQICRRALASFTKMISTIPENISETRYFLVLPSTGGWGHGNYTQAILSKLEYPNSDIILHSDFKRGISFLSTEYLNVISTKTLLLKESFSFLPCNKILFYDPVVFIAFDGICFIVLYYQWVFLTKFGNFWWLIVLFVGIC